MSFNPSFISSRWGGGGGSGQTKSDKHPFHFSTGNLNPDIATNYERRAVFIKLWTLMAASDQTAEYKSLKPARRLTNNLKISNNGAHVALV